MTRAHRSHLATAAITLCLGLAMAPAWTAEGAFAAARDRMVQAQIVARGVADERVLGALRAVPRHEFVSADQRGSAYDDRPLPIGRGQTISQPYIVALMTELAAPAGSDTVLEVGTGSGYQAAVLSPLVRHVYTIELEDSLAAEAASRLARLDFRNVTVKAGDGYAGWPDHAPFDIIMVTAAPDHIPAALIEQLKPGGRMIIPVGPVGAVQQLRVIRKDASGALQTTEVAAVRFVPLRRAE